MPTTGTTWCVKKYIDVKENKVNVVWLQNQDSLNYTVRQ